MRCGAPASYLLEQMVFSTSPWWTIIFIIVGFTPAVPFAFFFGTSFVGAFLLTPVIGFFPFLIIDFIFRLVYRMRFDVPLCSRHRYHFTARSAAYLAGWLLMIGSIIAVGYFISSVPEMDRINWRFVLAAVGVCVLGFMVLVWSTFTRIKAYDTTARGMMVCGVSEQFARTYEESAAAD